MKKIIAVLSIALLMAGSLFAKSLDDFTGEVGDNYVGYIEDSIMVDTCSEFDEHLIREVCASAIMGDGKTYYRCGPLVKGLGTRVTKDQFDKIWWSKFGGKMLTLEELSAIPNPDIDETEETN